MMKERMRREVERCAARQQGMLTRAQLLGLGVTSRQIDTRVKNGAWNRTLPSVFRCAAAASASLQRIWAAWLWLGPEALVSHHAAAELYGLGVWGEEPVHLMTPGWAKAPVPWVIVHQHRAIDKGMRRGRAGLSVTSPSQTLLDLAAQLEEPELEEVFHAAIQRRITSQSELRRLFARLPARGAPGSALLGKLLRDSSPDAARQSDLERRVFRHFRRHRLPTPECQYKLIAGDRKLGEVDFAWPEAKVVVEAEGFEIHTRRHKWSSDLTRYNEMVLEGWLVVRLTWSDVEGEGSPRFARLRQVIRERTRSGGGDRG